MLDHCRAARRPSPKFLACCFGLIDSISTLCFLWDQSVMSGRTSTAWIARTRQQTTTQCRRMLSRPFSLAPPVSTRREERRCSRCEHGLIPLDQVDDDQAAENRCGGAFVSYCTFPRSQSLFLCPVAIPHAAHNMADYFIYASDAMHPYQSSQKVARASVSQRLDPDGTRSQRARGFSALRRPHFTPPVV